MAKAKKAKNFYDYALVFIVIFIALFGMVMLYSASSYTSLTTHNDPAYLLKRQAIFGVISVVAMLMVSRFDYHLLAPLALPIYGASLILLLATFVIGTASHGSLRWLELFGIKFQPSELMKIAIIVVVSTLITHFGSRMSEWRVSFYCLMWALGPFVLVAANNLSTAVIILGIASLMIFIANRHYMMFALGGGFVALVYIFAYPVAKMLEAARILKDYQLLRIFMWKDPASYPDQTFQTVQGLYAIGSGGLLGKGLGESIQKFLLPEAQNDMIFTIICEEFGLFGAISVILLFAFVIYRMLRIALNARDLFGSMLVIGVMCHISLQLVLNIAVVTNVIPNTGITLPFISYGGTSLLLLMCEIGIVLSVSRQIRLDRI